MNSLQIQELLRDSDESIEILCSAIAVAIAAFAEEHPRSTGIGTGNGNRRMQRQRLRSAPFLALNDSDVCTRAKAVHGFFTRNITQFSLFLCLLLVVCLNQSVQKHVSDNTQ
jgi:hypothetical protein